ncbi:MAG: hypothetical protein L6R38_002609 [Xanthoria sp. 2 TBL-2021]|nr:MAG: hypothetical protein L6R38_002609 [Xanthoria sp. 2 TBL-2021]
MSKKAINVAEKELPPTPRTYQASEQSIPDYPEVYFRDGLCPRVVLSTIPEVQTGVGPEKIYEGLETKPNGYDPPTLVVKDDNSSQRNTPTGVPPLELFNATTPLPRSDIKPNDWRGRSIYQIITDRFSPSNSAMPCDVAKQQYCGGTWQGIINRLDYIQNMGFTAIWISPVTAQLDEKTAEGEAYHGYWQQNIFALNSHFGTVGDLQALATALHARNMSLMVDVVVNHFGWAGNDSNLDYSKMYPFDDRKHYHPYCNITSQDYLSNQTAVEQCWLGDDVVSLPDIDTTSTFVRETYDQWIDSFVSVFGIDGLRIDTVKHVEKTFWSDFKSAAGVYTLGEVFDGDVAYTCPYQEQLDGLLNYPLYYPLTRAFQDTNGNTTSLGAALTTIQDSCRDPTLLATFSENHDIPRFLNQRNDMNADMNAIVFTILAGGIPIIYQGQEQGFFGGNDPANREALWTSGYSTKSPLYMLIASVNQVRNHEVFASPDYITAPTSVIYTDDHHIALRKGNIVSLYSNDGSNGTLSNITLTNTGFQKDQPTIEILTCRNSTTDANGNLKVSVQEGQPQVFCPSAALRSSGICFL